MKKYLLISSLLIALISCKKDMTNEEKKARTQGDLTYTIQLDSLKEINRGDTVVFHFDKNPETHKLWMIDMWWGDAEGNVLAGGKWLTNVGGYGVRFTPIDPRNPNGEQVPQYFTWYMEDGDKIIANIGGNRAEVSVSMDNLVTIHQIPGPGVNEIERYYWGHRITNGTYMKGVGAKRPG